MSKGVGLRRLDTAEPWHIIGLQRCFWIMTFFSNFTLFPVHTKWSIHPYLGSGTCASHCGNAAGLMGLHVGCFVHFTWQCQVTSRMPLCKASGDDMNWFAELYRGTWLWFFLFFAVLFLQEVHSVLCLIKKMTTVSQFFSELEHLMNITCFGDLSCTHFCHRITGILCVIMHY